MSDVVNLAEHRRACATLPSREPDLELHVWLEKGEADWVYICGDYLDQEPDRRVRVSTLIDGVWVYAMGAEEEHERPFYWWLLGADGKSISIHESSIAKGTRWKHARWFIRQWWRMTKRVASLVFRIARGRG